MKGRGHSLLSSPETIAGYDTASLSDNDVKTMLADVRGQLAARASQIEKLKAESGGKIDQDVWQEHQTWRRKAAALTLLLEKEWLIRKPASKAASRAEGDAGHRKKQHNAQTAYLAAFLASDAFLDGQSIEDAARDAVSLARLCVDAVWAEIESRGESAGAADSQPSSKP